MMKKVTTLLLAVMMVLSLAACGSSNETGGSTNEGSSKSGGEQEKKEKEVVKLKFGHIANKNNAWHKGALKFAELVKEKTNGSVIVEVFPSSQLGNDRDLIEGMKMGSVDFALPAGVISNFQPEFSLLELPFLFRDKEHLEKVLYGPIGEELKANLLKDNDIRGLQFWMRGPRQLTSNVKVDSVDDLEGLKIRVPEIPAFVDAWKAMGANPTPMAFGDVYTSLQTGVIDAQENPFALIHSTKFQEVQDYLVLTEHLYGYVMLAMSDKTYQKLTPEQQKAVEEAAKEATQFENKLVFENEDKLLQKLKDGGMKVIEIEDKSEFKDKVLPVQKKYAEKYGKELYEKIINTK